tara:strand:- start:849 stop:1163 length:315 start_codon:yes stop_codon:yes gene_type:complete
MQVLKNADEIIKALAEAKLKPPNKSSSLNYNDKVTFECGCGTTHTVNDTTNKIFGIALPVKFVLECRNSYLTFFQIKGFFKQTVTSFWSAKVTDFKKALEKLNK